MPVQALAQALQPAGVLSARLVNRHWASCLAGIVDTLYVVPEAFSSTSGPEQLRKAFPHATTVNLDLQDTFIAVTKDVKVSLERYTAKRQGLPFEEAEAEELEASPSAALTPAAGAAAPQGQAAPAGPPAQAPAQAGGNGAAPPVALPMNPIAALAEAFAAGLLNGNQNLAGVGLAMANPQVPGLPGAAAAPAPPPPPTFLYSAISTDPVPGVVPDGTTHLRVRLPDSMDVSSHGADVRTSWDYVAALLGRMGTRLQGLSMTTAPGGAHISMLTPLTQVGAAGVPQPAVSGRRCVLEALIAPALSRKVGMPVGPSRS
jgi:hypothetical protein